VRTTADLSIVGVQARNSPTPQPLFRDDIRQPKLLADFFSLTALLTLKEQMILARF
jgi:hypothetical protein